MNLKSFNWQMNQTEALWVEDPMNLKHILLSDETPERLHFHSALFRVLEVFTICMRRLVCLPLVQLKE